MNADASWDLIRESIGPMLLGLVQGTIPLTLITFPAGLVLALVVALMRLSSVPGLAQLARAYVSVVRGTPLIVQLFIVFYGLPEFGIRLEPFAAATVALTINVAGYAAEIIRSAILSIPRGQWEAAQTVGMGYTLTLRRVVLPQAARVAVPPLSNTLISLVKDTALASLVLVPEMLRVAQELAAPTGQYFALYAVAAVVYWIVCLVLSFVQTRLESRFDRYVAR